MPYLHGTNMPGIQLYFEDELTDEWKAAREAAIEWGKLRNHRKTTRVARAGTQKGAESVNGYRIIWYPIINYTYMST